MIFQFWKTKKMLQEAQQDPAKMVAGEATGIFIGILIIPGLVVLAVLALFFTLGFTGLLFGPFAIFKTLFYWGIIVSVVVGFVAYIIARLVHRTTRKAVHSTIEKTKDAFTTK